MLKPQDILVLLKLVALDTAEPSFSRLALELEMSPSEVHQAVKRTLKAGLLHTEAAGPGSHKKTVNRHALLEFLIHGLKYVFPPERGGETRGIPTAHAAPPLAKRFARGASRGAAPVWPYPDGELRGLEFAPLYRSVPAAAKRDQKLYELLVLIDAIRGGRARERSVAEQELRKRLVA